MYICKFWILAAGKVSTAYKERMDSMKQELEAIRRKAEQDLNAAESQQALEALRVQYLGKKGEVTAILKKMGGLSPEERPVIGQLANEVRSFIEQDLVKRAAELKDAELKKRLEAEKIDVTMPREIPRNWQAGILFLLFWRKLRKFSWVWALISWKAPKWNTIIIILRPMNIPKDHPARDTQDTFYINDNILLRTQTSSVQVRVMEKQKPPIRVISPGRVYRSDALDATHSPLFHQIEGLVVDKGISFADLKGTLETFIKRLYGEDSVVRFRPHHFPFTEPSAEVDVQCFNCHGEGCRLCKGEGWIEILGCGMVHPKVLSNCGIDPEVYSGFALGMGLERVVMRRYAIDDIRLFYENDVRFLKQF